MSDDEWYAATGHTPQKRTSGHAGQPFGRRFGQADGRSRACRPTDFGRRYATALRTRAAQLEMCEYRPAAGYMVDGLPAVAIVTLTNGAPETVRCCHECLATFWWRSRLSNREPLVTYDGTHWRDNL